MCPWVPRQGGGTPWQGFALPLPGWWQARANGANLGQGCARDVSIDQTHWARWSKGRVPWADQGPAVWDSSCALAMPACAGVQPLGAGSQGRAGSWQAQRAPSRALCPGLCRQMGLGLSQSCQAVLLPPNTQCWPGSPAAGTGMVQSHRELCQKIIWVRGVSLALCTAGGTPGTTQRQ